MVSWGVFPPSILKQRKSGKCPPLHATVSEQLKEIAEEILLIEIEYRNKDASHEEKKKTNRPLSSLSSALPCALLLMVQPFIPSAWGNDHLEG